MPVGTPYHARGKQTWFATYQLSWHGRIRNRCYSKYEKRATFNPTFAIRFRLPTQTDCKVYPLAGIVVGRTSPKSNDRRLSVNLSATGSQRKWRPVRKNKQDLEYVEIGIIGRRDQRISSLRWTAWDTWSAGEDAASQFANSKGGQDWGNQNQSVEFTVYFLQISNFTQRRRYLTV